RVCRRHVEPGGKAGEAGTGFCNCVDRASGHDLGSHGAEQVEEGNEEIFDPLLFCSFTQRRHSATPCLERHSPKKGVTFLPVPESNWCPRGEPVPSRPTRQ